MNLLINENPLQVLPSLAKAIGLNEAMFLQQVHYWLNRSDHHHDDKRWIYNTAAGWVEQFPFWSEKTIRRIIKTLKDEDLIETTDKFNRKSYDKTTWITVNYQRLALLEIQSKPKPTGQVDQSVMKPTGQVDQSVMKPTGQSVHIDVDKLTRPIPETTRDYKAPSPKKPATPRQQKKPTDKNHSWFVKWWCFVCATRTGTSYAFTKKDAAIIKRLLGQLGLNELTARACAYLLLPDQKRFPRGAPTLGGLSCQINEVTRFDDEMENQFVAAGLLPDLDQIKTLTDFNPWSRGHEQQQSFTA